MSKDIKLLNYINSLNGLSTQQKSKIAESATSIEDVSIMLKEMPAEVKSADIKNSVWQNKADTNFNELEFVPTLSSPSTESKPVVKIQNEPKKAKPNFFSGLEAANPKDSIIDVKDQNGNVIRVIEKKYHKNDVLKELTERERSVEGKFTKEYAKEYDKHGRLEKSSVIDYHKNGRNKSKETIERYDKKGVIMSKKAINYQYDSEANIISETGETYDENDKPVKSYEKNYEINKQGQMYKSTTKKYDAKGNPVSLETSEEEVVGKDILRKTTSVYDKNGELFSKFIDDTKYNNKLVKIKNTMKKYEKGNLKWEIVSGAERTKENYSKNLITERTFSVGNKTITERFDNGKIKYKQVNTSKNDDKGNLIKETIEKQDERGKFLSKKIITRDFNNNREATGIVVENIDKDNKLIFKSISSIQMDSASIRTAQTTEIYDKKNNLSAKISTKYRPLNEKACVASHVRTNYKDGKVISTETIEPSEVEGEYNYKSVDIKGNVGNFIDSKKSANGVNIVKKFESPDGTKTDYQYSEDNKGNTKLLYKIIDKNGKELMSTERDYQKINDNLAVSKVDGKEYRIETENDKIKVFDVANKKYTQIDLNKLIKGDNAELKNTIKNQPGDVLIGLSKEINKIGSDINNGQYVREDECIMSDSKSSTIVHEFGHSIDGSPNEVNEVVMKCSQNEEFLTTLNEEKENFKNSSVEAEEFAFSYLDTPTEFVAETKMVTTTKNDMDLLSMRDIMLMKNFPKSIANASKLLKETEESQKPKKVM